MGDDRLAHGRRDVAEEESVEHVEQAHQHVVGCGTVEAQPFGQFTGPRRLTGQRRPRRLTLLCRLRARGPGRRVQPLGETVEQGQPDPVGRRCHAEQHLAVRGERHERGIVGETRPAGRTDAGPQRVVPADTVSLDGDQEFTGRVDEPGRLHHLRPRRQALRGQRGPGGRRRTVRDPPRRFWWQHRVPGVLPDHVQAGPLQQLPELLDTSHGASSCPRSGGRQGAGSYGGTGRPGGPGRGRRRSGRGRRRSARGGHRSALGLAGRPAVSAGQLSVSPVGLR
ncbi:UNVERIFIED_CONTAM: hypothetical protein RKD43_006746 [Streptomyces graminofaciens]